MDYTVNNWLVVTINSNKEIITAGEVSVEKKFFETYEEAYEYMDEKSKSYKNTKEILCKDTSKVCVQVRDYFVHMEIINCSTNLKIDITT